MSGPQPTVARRMCQVPLAAFVIGSQAESSLLMAIERDRRRLGVAAMTSIDTIDRRATITLEPEQRADAIHDSQDTNSPAGKTDRADVVNIPATTYFPKGLPPEYLRRWRA